MYFTYETVLTMMILKVKHSDVMYKNRTENTIAAV